MIKPFRNLFFGKEPMDWRFNTIWYEQLPKGSFKNIDFSQKSEHRSSLLGGSYVLTRKFKSKSSSLEDFPAEKTVKYLCLNLSNIKSFTGISRVGNLKRLEAHYCLKLECDSGLAEIGESLEWLHINQSKKFSHGQELLGLQNLKVLCLNSCAPIPDLDFLHLFPNLLDFRFVNTTILSGDLTPILQHPTLCSVGFMNMQHYNIKDIEINEHLHARNKASIKKIYKGSYETFRYT